MLARQGAFRAVQVWWAQVDETGEVRLRSKSGQFPGRVVRPQVLADPTGRRLVLLASDCTSAAWADGTWWEFLRQWGARVPMTVLQLLPEVMWRQTVLGQSEGVQLGATVPGAVNTRLRLERETWWLEEEELREREELQKRGKLPALVSVPVISLEPYGLRAWARVMAGVAQSRLAGYGFAAADQQESGEEEALLALDGAALFERFWATASPLARRLAALMAATSVTLPIVRLIQQVMVPRSSTVQVAEVFLSGILELAAADDDPERRRYEFVLGVRELLLGTIPRWEALSVVEQVSRFVARRLGVSLREFEGMIFGEGEGELDEGVRAFAEVTKEVLNKASLGYQQSSAVSKTDESKLRNKSVLLKDFRRAYQSLQMMPLTTKEDWKKYYVPYDIESVECLQQVIEDCTPASNKIVFTGHLGCGKSTRLNEVARRVEDDFFVVSFSIDEVVEMSDVNHINILFAIGVQMMEVAQTQKIELTQSLRDRLNNWFTTITKTQAEEPISTTLTNGFDFSLLKGQLKSSDITRKQIKRIFEPRHSELIDKLNSIAQAIETTSEKQMLVIIDGLDKLGLGRAREVYAENMKILFQPNFRIIFTIPMAVLREFDLWDMIKRESHDQLRWMSAMQLYERPSEAILVDRYPLETRKPRTEAFQVFKKVLARRIPEQLIEPEAVDLIIHYSGGVLRELIRLAYGCCGECLLRVRRGPENQDIKITAAIVETVVKDLRNDFAAVMSDSSYKILKDVYYTLSDSATDDMEYQKFLNLLHSLYILEYRDEDFWYDVHPIAIDLLSRKGYLSKT